MNKKLKRFSPSLNNVDGTLESRIVLNGNLLHKTAAIISPKSLQANGSTTTLSVTNGTLGQPMTFNITVKANSARAGAINGTVSIIDRGVVVQTIPVSSPKPARGQIAAVQTSVTLTPVAGGGAYYFGDHSISAVFKSKRAVLKNSTGVANFTVPEPKYVSLPSGTKIATIIPGPGTQIQVGQTANVLYTGYLKSNGTIFDSSSRHGGTPMPFVLGSGQVVSGFEDGVAGMKVGESRLVEIPPAEAYGANANGAIPANSTLVFEITLNSIS